MLLPFVLPQPIPAELQAIATRVVALGTRNVGGGQLTENGGGIVWEGSWEGEIQSWAFGGSPTILTAYEIPAPKARFGRVVVPAVDAPQAYHSFLDEKGGLPKPPPGYHSDRLYGKISAIPLLAESPASVLVATGYPGVWKGYKKAAERRYLYSWLRLDRPGEPGRAVATSRDARFPIAAMPLPGPHRFAVLTTHYENGTLSLRSEHVVNGRRVGLSLERGFGNVTDYLLVDPVGGRLVRPVRPLPPEEESFYKNLWEVTDVASGRARLVTPPPGYQAFSFHPTAGRLFAHAWRTYRDNGTPVDGALYEWNAQRWRRLDPYALLAVSASQKLMLVQRTEPAGEKGEAYVVWPKRPGSAGVPPASKARRASRTPKESPTPPR